MKAISQEGLRLLLKRGATPTQALLAVERSNLSSRARVLREANRRGKWFGILSRSSQPLGRAEALLLATDSAAGRDVYQNCAVPDRWRHLFVRTFVKVAVLTAHTGRNVSVRSKYGV